MKTKIGLSGLLYTGIGSILGSGWLMSSYLIAQDSGPSALLSWLVGAIIISIIAVNFIEVCAFLPPKDGGFGHYVDYTHNSFLSFLCDWVFLLSWIGLIPAEATATVQYLSELLPWKNAIVMVDGSFTALGTLITSSICFLFFIINYVSLTTLMQWIKSITIFKIVIPIIVVCVFLLTVHHFENLGISSHRFMPYGYHALLHSITTRGVVFAFIGFQTPVTFAAIAHNPKKNIPLAIMLSVIFCTAIYALLQLAYLIAVPAHNLIDINGWKTLTYSAPFFDLSKIYHLKFLLYFLSLAAFIAPFGAGLVFYASAVRITVGFSQYLPSIIARRNKNKVPLGVLLFVLGICFAILWLLPGWKMIVSIICVSLVVLFAIVCLINGTLNKFTRLEKKQHGIYIRGSDYFALMGFIAASLMYFWSSWPLTWKGLLVMAVGIPFYLFFHSKRSGWKTALIDFITSIWMLCYVITITIISYFSATGSLSYNISQILVCAIAVVFYFIGINVGKSKPILTAYMKEIVAKKITTNN